MDAPSANVFVLSIRALAGPRNSEPDGRRYDLLVFARGEDEATAQTVAREGLDSLGWDEPEVLRCGEITDPAAVPEDLQGAMGRARANGCSVIVYDLP